MEKNYFISLYLTDFTQAVKWIGLNINNIDYPNNVSLFLCPLKP